MKIRSVLEYAAPEFSSMLTAENISDIERIQKIVFKVILADQYQSYDQACQLLNAIPLENRRKQLSLKFALACLKNPKHRHHFKQRISPYYKLRKIKSFEEPFCHSQRYYLSPVPYLTRLLNEHFETRVGSY